MPLDFFPTHLLLVALMVFLLAQADSVLTLTLLGTGSFYEANPLMEILLRQESTAWFVNGRSLAWGTVLTLLVAAYSRVSFKGIRVVHVLYGLAGAHLLHTGASAAALLLLG